MQRVPLTSPANPGASSRPLLKHLVSHEDDWVVIDRAAWPLPARRPRHLWSMLEMNGGTPNADQVCIPFSARHRKTIVPHTKALLRLATSRSPGHDQDVSLLCSMPGFHTNQAGLEIQAQLPAQIIPLPPLKISRTEHRWSLASTVTAEGGQPG